jgi:hypothetical protein
LSPGSRKEVQCTHWQRRPPCPSSDQSQPRRHSLQARRGPAISSRRIRHLPRCNVSVDGSSSRARRFAGNSRASLSGVLRCGATIHRPRHRVAARTSGRYLRGKGHDGLARRTGGRTGSGWERPRTHRRSCGGLSGRKARAARMAHLLLVVSPSFEVAVPRPHLTRLSSGPADRSLPGDSSVSRPRGRGSPGRC